MRAVIEALERYGLAWFITGSEALAAYGSPRQTMDVDIVVEAPAERLHDLAQALKQTHYYSDPVRFGNRTMAALVDMEGAGKVDLIVRDQDERGLAAMGRRRRSVHPVQGPVWISSLEDLVLAKLEWSEGSSELQLRDCGSLLLTVVGSEDAAYLDEWAGQVNVTSTREQVRADAQAA